MNNYQIEEKSVPPKSKSMPTNQNNALIGFIAGIIFPLLGLLLLYFFWGNGNFGGYFQQFTNWESPLSMEQSSKLISLSMIANLIPFYYFLNRRAYLTTRGIIIATMLFAVLIFLYKFVWQ